MGTTYIAQKIDRKSENDTCWKINENQAAACKKSLIIIEKFSENWSKLLDKRKTVWNQKLGKMWRKWLKIDLMYEKDGVLSLKNMWKFEKKNR